MRSIGPFFASLAVFPPRAVAPVVSAAVTLLGALALSACPSDEVSVGGDVDPGDTRDTSEVLFPSDTVNPSDTSNPADTNVAPDGADASDAQTTDADGAEVAPDPEIDWARLQYPPDHRGEAGTTLAVYGRVYEAGVTRGPGQGGGVEAELGLGAVDAALETWSWQPASFSVDVDDAANDEYVATLTLPASGNHRYAFRFRTTTPTPGPWLYADLDGSDDGFDLADVGRLEVVAPEPETLDWCRLQHPVELTAAPGAPSGLVFGRVYEAGITDAGAPPAGDDEYPIVAELGYGLGADPVTWTWVSASYTRDVGNDDEFEASFEVPGSEGDYHFAYRARLATEEDWVYCDGDGSDDGFDLADAGSLIVEIPPVDEIDFAILRPATATWFEGQTPATFEVVVFEAGETPGAGQAPGLAVQLGHGSIGAGYTWLEAAYVRDEDGLGTLDNDVYAVALPALMAGRYDVIANVTLDGGATRTFVDATGTSDGFDPLALGVATVRTPPPARPDWCRIKSVGAGIVAAPGGTVGPFGVEIYEPGTTPGGGGGLVAELGHGASGSEPSGGTWSWSGMSLEGALGNNDVFVGTFAAPATEGLIDAAVRVRLAGVPASADAWLYCDLDGSDDGYEVEQAVRVTVQAPRVDYCRIQYPTDPVIVAPGADTAMLYGVVYEPGLTGESGSHVPAITSQVGFGPTGSQPDASWTWEDGVFNVYADNGFGQLSNDEHRGTLTPSTAGTYAWAWRFSLDGGLHWRACDEAGNAVFDPAAAGTLIVQD